LGVDIERIKHQFGYRDIAAQYFSAPEVAFINGAEMPTEAFFLLWTRKEALLKACGTGIDDNLPQMPALDGFHLLPAHYNNTNWLTESFKAGANCIGSLTYSSPPTNISRQQMNNDEIIELLKCTGTNPAR
jgi:4'-phosphopantetheinyl transferase